MLQVRSLIDDSKCYETGQVECDEVYVTAGHKGHPESVKKKIGRLDDGD